MVAASRIRTGSERGRHRLSETSDHSRCRMGRRMCALARILGNDPSETATHACGRGWSEVETCSDAGAPRSHKTKAHADEAGAAAEDPGMDRDDVANPL